MDSSQLIVMQFFRKHWKTSVLGPDEDLPGHYLSCRVVGTQARLWIFCVFVMACDVRRTTKHRVFFLHPQPTVLKHLRLIPAIVPRSPPREPASGRLTQLTNEIEDGPDRERGELEANARRRRGAFACGSSRRGQLTLPPSCWFTTCSIDMALSSSMNSPGIHVIAPIFPVSVKGKPSSTRYEYGVDVFAEAVADPISAYGLGRACVRVMASVAA